MQFAKQNTQNIFLVCRIVEALLEYSNQLDLNPADEVGNTPLHLACEDDGHVEVKQCRTQDGEAAEEVSAGGRADEAVATENQEEERRPDENTVREAVHARSGSQRADPELRPDVDP